MVEQTTGGVAGVFDSAVVVVVSGSVNYVIVMRMQNCLCFIFARKFSFLSSV